MGLIRRELHSAGVNEMADWLRAIAHPARLTLLLRIAQSNDCICTDLSEELGLAQATVSQHLKVLRETGIIKGSISGNAFCYCIDQKFVRAFKKEFTGIMSELENAVCPERC